MMYGYLVQEGLNPQFGVLTATLVSGQLSRIDRICPLSRIDINNPLVRKKILVTNKQDTIGTESVFDISVT